MPFQKGRAKTGGRKKGTVNKTILARQQAITESMQTLGLAPETIDEITPLATMKLVMVSRLRAGDHQGALAAAAEAAPYCHARLASADLRIHDEYAGKTDEELLAEIAEIEQR